MKIFIISLLVVYVAAEEPAPVTKAEVNKAVNDLDKGLDKLNVTLSSEDKAKIKSGIERIANFKIENHPEIMDALKRIKGQVPELKNKVCKFAQKADKKIAPVSKKVGAGVGRGFDRLANDKFPLAVLKYKDLIGKSGASAATIATLSTQADKMEQCVRTRVGKIAAPLANIIQKAGARTRDVFKSLVEPFVEDAPDCDDANADDGDGIL